MNETRVDVEIDDAYRAALEFLYDRIDYERMATGSSRFPFRLKRIRTLLEQLGLERYLYRPGDLPPLPLVHIAGTKGKGSVASLVAAGLSASGLKTGLYTSPHLSRLEERYRVDGACCRPDELTAVVDRVRGAAEQLSRQSVGSPTFFELTTAMALSHFDSVGCDAIVLEVGLGGRLDSTNVCSPSVTAITSIGLDHQHVLGNTIAEIAAEKAGIIKADVPVVSGVVQREAADVIEDVAQCKGAPLFRLTKEFDFRWQPNDVWGSDAIMIGHQSPLQGERSFKVALEGKHQTQNAAVALALTDLLRDQGVSLDPDAIGDGIASLQCPGRIERFLLPQGTVAIVDAAHNADSIAVLCDCLRQRFSDRSITVVFGTSRDKSPEPMLTAIGGVADSVVLTRFHGNPRYTPTEELLPLVPDRLRGDVKCFDDPIAACREACQRATPGGVTVVCGSFFLVGETRDWIAAATE